MSRLDLSVLDSHQVQDLLEELVELKESRVWALVQDRQELLLSRDLRLLEAADLTELLWRYQGRVQGEREMLAVVDTLVGELKNRLLVEEKE